MAAMEQDPVVTVETLAPSKLLNYVQKDQLIRFLTPRRYSEIEHELKTTLNKTRVNLKDIKKHLATQDDFVSSLRQHPYGQEAFQKYRDAAERMRNINRTQAAATRRVMAEPRRRYQGCLATRLQPKDYEHCLDNYDNDEFDGIQLVPSALTQRVFDRGNTQTKEVLRATVTRRTGTFSDLPTGLRSYISHNPDQFKDYYEQRRHEVGLMKAVLKNLSNEDKRKLQAYYEEQGRIEPEKFSEIIATFTPKAEQPKKRPRVLSSSSSSTKGGGASRFDLNKKIEDNNLSLYGGLGDDMSDLSISDVLD